LEKHKKEILKKIHISKVIWPILIGLIVLVYMVYKQFNWDEFNKIEWNDSVLFGILISLLLYFIRHIAIAARLRLLSDKKFSWLKSIELIFIWEFSSAISPTAFGGSAVALYFLSQEKLKPSKAITLVLYTVVVDSAFFLVTLPILLFVLGPVIIRPGLTSIWDINQHVIFFFLTYLAMFLYSGFFFYGLFLHPEKIKNFLCWLARIKILKKFKKGLIKTGENVVIASGELAHKNYLFHLKAFIFTAIGWTLRFLVVNVLLIAFTSHDLFHWLDQFIIYGRSQNMYVETSFTPTPGSTGFAEYMFAGFFKDYIPEGLAMVIAIIWRIITYYFYLFAGIIVVPNWINRLLRKKHIIND
jgi:uncharacterized protein (TIRG00374 family)